MTTNRHGTLPYGLPVTNSAPRAALPRVLRSTAPFVYVRLHGPSQDWLYGGSYSDNNLAWWAERFREWEGAGQEVYAYFNNDGAGNAVLNARRLRQLLETGSLRNSDTRV